MISIRRFVSVFTGGLLLAASPIAVQAQTGTVTGRVVDSTTHTGVTGAAVIMEGTTLGTRTRPDGSYSIDGVPAGTRSVRATRIGFRPQSLSVVVAPGASVTANFSLGAVATQLSQVVTIAYGSGGAQSTRDVSGSVVSVDSSLFNKGRVVTPEELIQAKVPGVQIINNSQPGGGITIRVRGGTSITASNDPLFVIDGVPLPVGGGLSGGRNPLNFLNPQDIANITVLKDAAATTIYGSRGANGVVLITMKSGSDAGAQISYGSSFSSSSIVKAPHVLDADQFRQAVQDNAPNNLQFLGTANTNFFDAIRRTAYGQDHNFAFGAARQDMRYRLALGYLNQQGVLEGDRTRRYSGAFNYSDQLLNNMISLVGALRVSRTNDIFAGGRVLGDALNFAPTQPITNPNGTFFEFANNLAPANPLERLAVEKSTGRTDRGIGNVEVRTQLPFISGLSATVRGSFDNARTTQTDFAPSTARTQQRATYKGFFTNNLPDATTLVLDTYGNYTHHLASYATDVDVTGGYSFETFRGNNSTYSVQGLSTNLLGDGGVDPAAANRTTSFNIQESRLASFFGRANFIAKDRYLLGLGIRRDGSSRFGINNQWGLFTAASVGWRLSEEGFFKGRVPGLSDLKLRYSYGTNGNQAFANYLAISTYSYSSTPSQILFGTSFIPTVAPTAANPNLKWETTAQHNAGVDYGLLDGRISGTLEYYVKNTTNLLFNVPVAAGTNFGNRVVQNVGSMRNAGVDASISAQVLRGTGSGMLGRLRYDANFIASTNRNRVIAISTTGGASQIATGGLGFITLQTIRPDLPINTFLLYQHKNDADGNPVTGKNAAYNPTYYVDQNGDGQINQADLVPGKSPQPKWILGHTSQFGYKNVDLGFTLRANLGVYQYNAVAAGSTFSAVQGAGFPSNLNTDVFKYGFVTGQPFSDLYVEDASFLRMDNLTLGFNLPRERVLTSTRVFATVQNVFTVTKFTGLDPQSNALNGINGNQYPLSRTLTLGLNVGF